MAVIPSVVLSISVALCGIISTETYTVLNNLFSITVLSTQTETLPALQ